MLIDSCTNSSPSAFAHENDHEQSDEYDIKTVTVRGRSLLSSVFVETNLVLCSFDILVLDDNKWFCFLNIVSVSLTHALRWSVQALLLNSQTKAELTEYRNHDWLVFYP